MTATRRIRTTLATTLLPLLAAPLLMQASAVQAADPQLDACIQAFVSTNLEKDRPVKIRKFESFERPLISANKGPVLLTAHLRSSGKQLVKATCVADGKDIVLMVDGKPATKLAAAPVRQAKSENIELSSR